MGCDELTHNYIGLHLWNSIVWMSSSRLKHNFCVYCCYWSSSAIWGFYIHTSVIKLSYYCMTRVPTYPIPSAFLPEWQEICLFWNPLSSSSRRHPHSTRHLLDFWWPLQQLHTFRKEEKIVRKVHIKCVVFCYLNL